MIYSFEISTGAGDEYRIQLVDVDITMLATEVRNVIVRNDIDISEIVIDKIKGGDSTGNITCDNREDSRFICKPRQFDFILLL